MTFGISAIYAKIKQASNKCCPHIHINAYIYSVSTVKQQVKTIDDSFMVECAQTPSQKKSTGCIVKVWVVNTISKFDCSIYNLVCLIAVPV